MSSPSNSVVTFVSRLHPLYVPEERDGITCARSLIDGTLVQPAVESDDSEGENVEIWWQGDANRATRTSGVFIARIAIAAYVQFHSVGEPGSIQTRRQDLAEHFRLKTGQSLGTWEVDDDALVELWTSVGQLSRKLGPEAVLVALKKLLGG